MKGITSVVAVILIIIITMVIVATTVYWFSVVTQRANEQVALQQEAERERQGKRIRIINYNESSDMLFIKNAGTAIIESQEIVVYINSGPDNLLTACNWNSTILTAGETAQCVHANSCSSGDSLKVAGPANFDIVVC